MPGSQIIYDGLWRCLCPSVGLETLTRALRPRRAPHLSDPARRAAFCERPQPRHASFTTLADRREPAESAEAIANHALRSRRQYLDRADRRAPWLNRLLSLRPGASPEFLHRFSTPQIYDALKELQNMEDTYQSIIVLAEYLINERKETPNAQLYEALIRANVDPFRGSAKAAQRLLDEMTELGIHTTPAIYHAILQVTAIHPDYVLRSKALLDMKQRWYTPTLDGNINVIIGLLRDGQYELALERLEELSKGPVMVPPWLYSIFLVKFGELGFHEESFQLLQHAVKIHNPQRSLLAWAFLLDVYSRDGYYAGINYIWEHMVSPGKLNPSDGVALHCLNAACHEGDVELATKVLVLLTDRGRKLGVHHYEALIDANVKWNGIENALRVLCLMSNEGLSVDASSTRSIFSILSISEAETNRALRLLVQLRSERRVPIAAFNVVLEAVISQRGFSAALDTYRSVMEFSSDRPDLRTFHILLSRCTKEKSLNFLVAEMEAFAVKPTRATYNRLIRITARQPNYEPAFRYLQKIRELRKPTDSSPTSNLWMGRSTALELIKRCIQNHDGRAQELIEESRARGMALDSELVLLVAEVRYRDLQRLKERADADADAGAGGTNTLAADPSAGKQVVDSTSNALRAMGQAASS